MSLGVIGLCGHNFVVELVAWFDEGMVAPEYPVIRHRRDLAAAVFQKQQIVIFMLRWIETETVFGVVKGADVVAPDLISGRRPVVTAHLAHVLDLEQGEVIAVAVPALKIGKRMLGPACRKFPAQHVDRDIRPLRTGLAKDLEMETARRPASYRHDDAGFKLPTIFLIHAVKDSFIDEAVKMARQRCGERMMRHDFFPL